MGNLAGLFLLIAWAAFGIWAFIFIEWFGTSKPYRYEVLMEDIRETKTFMLRIFLCLFFGPLTWVVISSIDQE